MTPGPRPHEETGRPLLELDDVRKTFERRRAGRLWRGHPEYVRAVDGVSLSIRPGEVLGLVGESGSGKTTVGRCIAGLEPVSGGSIRLCGDVVSGLSSREFLPYRRDVQMVFQDSHGSLDPRATVYDTVAEPLRLLARAPQREVHERVLEILSDVGIEHDLADRFRHQLSGGQAQRVNIARALVVRPRLVVLDEAVSALDASVQARVVAMLDALRRSHSLTYLFISHDLHAVRAISDRVGVMYRGRLVEVGETTRVFVRPEHPYTRLLLASSLVPSGDTERDEDERRALREQVRRLDEAAPPQGVAR